MSKIWLFSIYGGSKTTQIYRDYNKPFIKDPYQRTRIQWKVGVCFFFSWLNSPRGMTAWMSKAKRDVLFLCQRVVLPETSMAPENNLRGKGDSY